MTSIAPVTGFVLSPNTVSTPFITQRPSLPSLFVDHISIHTKSMDQYLFDDDSNNYRIAPPLMEQRRRFYKKGTALWATPPSGESTKTTPTTSEESLLSLNNNNNNNNNNQGQVLRVEQDEKVSSSTTINVDNDTISLSLEQQTNGEITNNDDITSLWKDLPSSSIVWLNAVAIIWGTQHPVIKMVVEDSDAAAFSLARFGLGAIIASPYTPGLSTLWKKEPVSDTNGVMVDVQHEQENVRIAWRWGIEMGLWMFLGYAFQAVGLAFTTAQRSGFLLYLNVKFVPFFARILFGRQISIPTWVSAFAALVGTALLAGGDGSIAPNVGDAWSIGAAAMSAMFILRLESASKEVEDSAQLNAASLWVVTFLAFLWSIVVGGTMTTGATADAVGGITMVSAWEQSLSNLVSVCTNHPLELIYLGGVTTALANYMQTRAQRNVTAERASVIYAMDPVYGAFFANLLLGEQLEGWAIVGAAIITVTAATNAFLDLSGSSGSNGTKQKNLEDML